MEARTYFSDYVRDHSALPVDTRSTVLAIVALHADRTTWETLHTLAQTATSEIEKQEIYGYLGAPRDPDLAQRALQLVLTDEAIVTTRPDIMSAVSQLHADMAFDFAASHREAVMAMLEPETRNQFIPDLASHSHEQAMIPKVRAYAKAHIPATARQSAVKAEAQIAYKVKIRQVRLGAVDRWLKAAEHGTRS